MSVILIILTIVSTVIIGWVVVRNRLMWIEFHFNNTSRLMEQRAQQLLADRSQVEQYAIQLSDRLVELDRKEKEIGEERVENAILREHLNQRSEELKSIIKNNKEVLRLNEKVLKKNATQLYHLKEASCFLYTHYNSIVKLSDSLLAGNGIEVDQLGMIRSEAEYNIRLINEYFFNNFRMTIDQYKKSLTNIVARPDTSGGDTTLGLITDSSLN